MQFTPKHAIITIIIVGIIGIILLSVSLQEPEISTEPNPKTLYPKEPLKSYIQNESQLNKIVITANVILPIQLDKVINSCKNSDNEIQNKVFIKWSNGTHFIDSTNCMWQENSTKNNTITNGELLDVTIHKKVAQNLVKNLIEKYDKEGLENLHQADFTMILTGGVDGTRNLFIIDTKTDTVIGDARELNKNASRSTIIQNNKLYFNHMYDRNNQNGYWLEENFTIKEIGTSFHQLLWLVPHDGLIFGVGYVIDDQGRSFN